MYIKNMVSIHLNITQASNLIVILKFCANVSHVCYIHIIFTLSCNYEIVIFLQNHLQGLLKISVTQ